MIIPIEYKDEGKNNSFAQLSNLPMAEFEYNNGKNSKFLMKRFLKIENIGEFLSTNKDFKIELVWNKQDYRVEGFLKEIDLEDLSYE